MLCMHASELYSRQPIDDKPAKDKACMRESQKQPHDPSYTCWPHKCSHPPLVLSTSTLL